MANNSYVNKVQYNGQTLIDLTGDTATEADVVKGKSFHKASGASALGTAEYVPIVGKGVSLLDNGYFIGGGSQQGGGQFPINQRSGRVVKKGVTYYESDSSGAQLVNPVGQTTEYYNVTKYKSYTAEFEIEGTTYYVRTSDCVSGYVGSGYGIDRWYCEGSSGYVTIQPDCIRLCKTDSYYNLINTVSAENLKGLTVTFSALINATVAKARIIVGDKVHGTGGSGHYVVDQSSSLANGMSLVSVTVTVPDNNLSVYIQPQIAFDANGICDVYATKLELGDTQTLARNVGTEANPQWVLNDPPPNYQQELAKCQRYLRPLAAAYPLTMSFNTTTAWASIPLSPPMRAKPTLQNVSNFLLWRHGSAVGGAEFADKTSAAGSENVAVVQVSGATLSYGSDVYQIGGNGIFANAEI